MLPMPLAPLVLLAVAGRPLERLGPPAACAGSVCAVTARRAATANAESTLRVTCLLLIEILCFVGAGCVGAELSVPADVATVAGLKALSCRRPRRCEGRGPG